MTTRICVRHSLDSIHSKLHSTISTLGLHRPKHYYDVLVSFRDEIDEISMKRSLERRSKSDGDVLPGSLHVILVHYTRRLAH